MQSFVCGICFSWNVCQVREECVVIVVIQRVGNRPWPAATALRKVHDIKGDDDLIHISYMSTTFMPYKTFCLTLAYSTSYLSL